jgi:hypothetical protein
MRLRPDTRSSTATSVVCTAWASSPASTGQPSGGTKTSSSVTPIRLATGRGQADPRRSPAGHRDHPGRQDRLCGQLPVRHGDPHPHRHRHYRNSHQGRELPLRDRDYPQRENRLRRQLLFGHRDPHPHRYQHCRCPIPQGFTLWPSRSHRSRDQ